MATEVATYFPQAGEETAVYNSHYRVDSCTHTSSCNNNNHVATRPPALDLHTIKQTPQTETQSAPASPRPLSPELMYQPQQQVKWRQSLDGNYTVTQQSLGEGASGKVILASDRRTGEVVAVKVVPKGRLRPDQLARIRREYSIMNQVGSHKHLVQLVDVIENPHEVCIIMNYASDGDLFSLISGSPEERLTEDTARKILRQVAKGIKYLHENGYVHRDIKPENIFLSGGRAILGDFGYAMAYNNTPCSTSVGSLHYASPEVILKDATYIGPEIDVWSLGCVLYAMVCGYTPFQGESVRETKLAIVRGQVDYPSHLSAEVKELISKMLGLSPRKRYTIEQVLAHEWTQKGKRASQRSHSSDHEPIPASSVSMEVPDTQPGTFAATVELEALPVSGRRSGTGSIRARLPRLPLAKLRQLWQSDKADKAPGRLSPTAPKSPLFSPTKSSPKQSQEATTTTTVNSGETDKVGGPSSLDFLSPPASFDSDELHSPSSGKPRRRNSSPRILSSPRKALSSLTDIIMSPRRRAASVTAKPSSPHAYEAPSPRSLLSLPAHSSQSHSDSYTSTPISRRAKARSSSCSSSDCSQTSSPTSSGEHATYQ